jgi:hypothetical protein
MEHPREECHGITEQIETPEPENESLIAYTSSFIPSKDSFISPVDYQSAKSFVVNKGKSNTFLLHRSGAHVKPSGHINHRVPQRLYQGANCE